MMHYKQVTYKANQFLGKPVVVIVLLLFVAIFFGYQNLEFQRDNKSILDGQKQTVDDLVKDNRQQTKLLCTLFLRGKVEIDAKEAAEIEQICEDEIQRFTEAEHERESNANNPPTPPLVVAPPVSHPPVQVQQPQDQPEIMQPPEDTMPANGGSTPSPTPPQTPDPTPPPPPEPQPNNLRRTVNHLIELVGGLYYESRKSHHP